MPYTTERMALNSPFLDRRCKLLPCQKERIYALHHRSGMPIRTLAAAFNVHKTLIGFICYPDRHERNLELRAQRGGSKRYYKREKHVKQMKEHRTYKHKTLKNAVRTNNN